MIEALFGVHNSLATLILRLAVGSLFIIHGYPKLGPQRQQGVGWMKSMGMPGGLIAFAGIVETLGGLGLILGLLTPIIGVLFALWMFSTMWLQTAKMKRKYMGGWELDVTLLLASLAIAALGSGVFSLDHLLGI